MEKTSESRKPVNSAASGAATAPAATPAELAKSALRRLALQRQEPTPANFARAWREEGGADVVEPIAAPAKAAVQHLSSRLAPSGSTRDALSASLTDALTSQRWDAVNRLLDTEIPSPAQQAQAWAELVERLVRQLERHQKQWTPRAQERESAACVGLGAFGRDPPAAAPGSDAQHLGSVW